MILVRSNNSLSIGSFITINRNKIQHVFVLLDSLYRLVSGEPVIGNQNPHSYCVSPSPELLVKPASTPSTSPTPPLTTPITNYDGVVCGVVWCVVIDFNITQQDSKMR